MLSKVTTALLDETEVERTQCWMKESMMVEFLALSDITDILFNVNGSNGSNDEDADPDVNPNRGDRDNDDMNIFLDPLDIGRGGEREGTGDEDDDVRNNIADNDVEQSVTPLAGIGLSSPTISKSGKWTTSILKYIIIPVFDKPQLKEQLKTTVEHAKKLDYDQIFNKNQLEETDRKRKGTPEVELNDGDKGESKRHQN